MNDRFDFRDLHYVKFKEENVFYVALVNYNYRRIYIPTLDKSFSLDVVYDFGNVDLDDGLFVAKKKIKVGYQYMDSDYYDDRYILSSKDFNLDDIKKLEDYKNSFTKSYKPEKGSIFNR